MLYRSLAQPSDCLPTLKAKQEALDELATDDAYRKQLESLVAQAMEREMHFYNLLFGTFTGFFGSWVEGFKIDEYGYTTYKRGTRFMLDMLHDADALPKAKAAILTTPSIRSGILPIAGPIG